MSRILSQSTVRAAISLQPMQGRFRLAQFGTPDSKPMLGLLEESRSSQHLEPEAQRIRVQAGP